jgi:hypothetical protein
MCAANGELEGGDAESPVDFLCQVAHLRAYALGLQVPEHGDCECCSGGHQHAALQESAKRIEKNSPAAAKVIPISGTKGQLPVLNTGGGCSAGGCSSCGVLSR